jgi:hypothetical protein
VPDGTAYEVYQGTLDPGAAALALSDPVLAQLTDTLYRHPDPS